MTLLHQDMARQLDSLRDRSRHVSAELHRIQDELFELIRGIESHFASAHRPPQPRDP